MREGADPLAQKDEHVRRLAKEVREGEGLSVPGQVTEGGFVDPDRTDHLLHHFVDPIHEPAPGPIEEAAQLAIAGPVGAHGQDFTKERPELWSQFMQSQSPLMQGLMGSYVEQSKNLFSQMQEQLQKQSEQMLASFVLKR